MIAQKYGKNVEKKNSFSLIKMIFTEFSFIFVTLQTENKIIKVSHPHETLQM